MCQNVSIHSRSRINTEQGLRKKEPNVPKTPRLQLVFLDLRKETLGTAFRSLAEADSGNLDPFRILK